jgi:hypothetical protein
MVYLLKMDVPWRTVKSPDGKMCIEMGKSSTNGGVSIAMFESPLWFGGHSGHVACPACPKIAIKNIGKIMFDIIDIPQKNANNREKTLPIQCLSYCLTFSLKVEIPSGNLT